MNSYQEKNLAAINGLIPLIISIAVLIIGVWELFSSNFSFPSIVISIMLVFLLMFIINGFFIINPNEAVVATFFGKYVGTKKDAGFFWMNPFNKGEKISTKVNNLVTQQLKVNDKNGNPIEIAAVISWHVNDPAKALFAVENYGVFLKNQAESAVRKIATQYMYDGNEEITLKNNIDDISSNLKETLKTIISFTGISISDTRLTHLAYAPEIAQVMLRKQQAEAIVAAREKIVEGALNMVEEVLHKMEEKKLAKFEETDKVKLINNLMTVLVSESEATPVVQLEK